MVIPTLKQVFGVADVTNFGGETTQFQLLLDPSKLAQYNLSLKQVMDAVSSNNSNAGGSMVQRGDEAFVVRGIGLIRSLDDLGNIVINQKNGTPVLLRNLGSCAWARSSATGFWARTTTRTASPGLSCCCGGKSLPRSGGPARQGAGAQPGPAAAGREGGALPRPHGLVQTTYTVSHTLLEGMTLVVLVLMLFLGSGGARSLSPSPSPSPCSSPSS